MDRPTVGLIGLGLMGHGIGKNLLAKGFALTVYDVAPTAVARLTALGAAAADSPRGVAERSRVVITVLPDGPQVEETVLGPEGVLAGARPGLVVLDCSTIDPAVTKMVGEALFTAGCGLVDAGMARSSKEAEEGRLLFMVGGRPEDLETARPVLEATGTDIYYCGGPTAGITMKVINNLLNNTVLAASAEALVLGRKAGLEVDVMMNLLTHTASDNPHLHSLVPQQILTGDFTPGFKASMAHKDFRLAQNLAARLGVPLFTLGQSLNLFSLVLARGFADRSHSIVGKVLADLAGVKLNKE
ncbi:MAG: NAD(P)-dependent oxidoreductase [Chloroflexota bacterium]